MRKKILIVDDQTVNRRILNKILSDLYVIVEAADGAEALSVLNAFGTEISAVLLDLVMPTIDGYGVLKAMSEDSILSSIPVIVASQADEMEEKALTYGARDFISKPYNAGVLRQRLKNLIELYESNLCITHIEKDTLTGLYTKDAFYRRALDLLNANPEERYMIVATNIERFKLVNDSFGNMEGDKLLQFMAGQILEEMERVKGICGRSSGDRFLAIVPQYIDNGGLQKVVDGAHQGLADYPLNMKISLKFGVYLVERRDIPLSIMCDRAMLAAESIKGKYDISCAYYDDSIRQRLLKEQQITNEMKQALAEHQFQVYFQPKYDLTSECIAGAEALVRWIHPALGFISPGEFIPLFEKNGFITALDQYVWDKTCEIIAACIKRGKKYVPVSVNVSRKDIYNRSLPELLTHLLKKHGLSTEHLHLEITETAYTEDADQLITVVGQLKAAGFVIEMDDFGSGYSSLNMLSELPIDVLKLDMRFIQKETERNNSRSILSFVISMAKWMNLSVVAEGVETQHQIDLLRNMDCDYVQGYYYARPMPPEDFITLVCESSLAIEQLTVPQPVRDASIVVHDEGEGKIMLIVDDIEINRTILAECFQAYYTIAETDNGVSAYNYIQEHFDEIAVIMLDLIMPEMDGFQLLKKLQSNALYSGIPVIVTSQSGKESEVEAFRLGASDFLSKPYDCEIALHRVQNVAARKEVQVLKREKQMLTRMRQLALEAKLDQFTGLYNRMEMERQVREYFLEKNSCHGVFIMLDIDNFKIINDTYGHDVGDSTIRQVAEILVKYFRSEDIVSRMGGDEFAIFVKTNMSEAQINMRMNKLKKGLVFSIGDHEVTCSIGVCVAPEHGREYQELYHNADVALLTAKRLGKNQFNIYGGSAELPDHILYRNMDWLLDESSDAVMVCDTQNYEVYYLNNVACILADKERTSCIGMPCYQVLWNRTSPCSHCIQIDKLTKDYCEHEIFPEGTQNCYLIKGKLIRWGDREARIQYIQDYTKHAAVRQEMLKVSEDRRMLLEYLPCGIFRCNADDRCFSYISTKMLDMLGYSEQEFLSKCHNCFDEAIWYEDRERVFAVIRQMANNSDYGACEFRIEKKDGTLCWIHADGYLNRSSQRKEYYVVVSDITREKKMEIENHHLMKRVNDLIGQWSSD